MILWVLDTDHVSLFQQGHPLIQQRINRINPEELAVTIITVQEQIRGWLSAIAKHSESESLVWAYKGLSDAVKYFNNIQILEFNNTAYNYFINLRQQRIRIGTQDLKIAATVLSVNGILVTRNQRDFAQVPGLVFEDWTIQ